MDRQEAVREGGLEDMDDDSSVEEIERGAGAAEADTDLEDFLLLLGDDGGGGSDSGLSSVDPRSLALFADVADVAPRASFAASEEDEKDESDPFSDSYRGPGAITAASAFSEGCLALLRAFAKSKELSRRCQAVATAVIERVNSADYTAWKLRWECSKALSGSGSGSGSGPSAFSPAAVVPAFLAAEARLCARVAARSGFKNYQLWNHRAKIIAEAAAAEGGEEREGEGEGNDEAVASAAKKADLVAEAELAFASAALADDAKNYHAWSHRCLVAGMMYSASLWAEEREFAGGAIEDDPGSNSAWAHRAAAVGALLSLSAASSSSSSSEEEANLMLEEEFALAARHARQRPHDAAPAWAHVRAVAGWKEAAAEAADDDGGGDNAGSSSKRTKKPRRRRHLPLPLASDPRFASLAAGVLQKHPGCVPALLLLHDAHALRALWASAGRSKGGGAAEAGAGAGEAAEAAEEASSLARREAAACRARLSEADPTRRGLWSSIG